MDTFDPDADLMPVNRALVRVIEVGGEEKLVELVSSGRMDAVLALSDDGYRIGRELGDVAAALDWQAAVPDRLGDVLAASLHKVRAAGDLMPETIRFLLDLPDRTTITPLAAMRPPVVETLPRHGAERVTMAARALNAGQAARFFTALGDVEALQARNDLWAALSNETGPMDDFLAKTEAVAASRNQEVAAEILFSDTLSLVQPGQLWEVATAAFRGEVAWSVVAQRYGMIAVVAVALAFLIGLTLWRMLFPPRTKVVIRNER